MANWKKKKRRIFREGVYYTLGISRLENGQWKRGGVV